MKPTNYNSEGCDPISSNCLIWQGPDLDCINLCKGDTVSTVVHKLATEICSLMEQLNVSNYDLACLDLNSCTPTDFKALIQLLIDKICELENIQPGTGDGGSSAPAGCPDCEVNICSEFYYTSPQGDIVTTMQLKDYVLAIGNRVCSLIGQVGTNTQTIQGIDIRVTALENAPDPTFDLPTMVPECVLPAIATDIDTVLIELEKEFCQLQNATGDGNAILLALNAACSNLASSPKLNGTGTMDSISGWVSSPSNLADSFNNLWLTVCDLRSAVNNILSNCCDTGCGGIDLTITATVIDVNTVRLFFTGSIPVGFVDNNPSSTVVLTDSANNGPQTINLVDIYANYFSTNQPYDITLDSGLSGNNDIYISTTYRFVNPQTQESCSNTIQSIAVGLDTCPDINVTVSYLNANFGFNWTGALGTLIVVELWNETETVLVQSQNITANSTNIASSFSNLTEGTLYKIRLVISGQPCEFESFTTLEYPCQAPSVGEPSFDYTNPEDDIAGADLPIYMKEYAASHPQGGGGE
jgi:hypothetical protein